MFDYVPVDYVCKLILAAAVTARRTSPKPPVFHVGTSHNNPVRLSTVAKAIEKYWKSVPAPRKRVSNDIRCEYYLPEEFNRRFEEKYGDQIRQARQNGDEKTVKAIEWLHVKSNAMLVYHSNSWVFEMHNAIELDESAPQELYSGLKYNMDWDMYLPRICYGTHKYLLGEPVDTVPKAYYAPRL